MSPQCTSLAAFDKDNHDYSYFSAWCCKTFCIHSLQIDFPWRKNIRFCDFWFKNFLKRAQVYFILPTPESIPVMAGNYCVSAPRGRKSRMHNSWDCPFKVSKCLVHRACERAQHITQSERHPCVFVEPSSSSSESGLLNVRLPHGYLVETMGKVKATEILSSLEEIRSFINVGKWVCILVRLSIEKAIVYTQPQLAIFLSHENYRGCIRAGRLCPSDFWM